jgi:putative ABC transport system permease protein
MSLSQDLRAALRQLARRPFGNGAAAATLALGIGSSVALFSLGDAVLLRPLPYPKADALVALWDTMPQSGHPRSRVSGFNYRRWHDEARTFEGLALVGSTSGALTGQGEPLEVEGFRVTCNTFALLGVRAQAGRAIREEDCAPAAPPVMAVSDALWRHRFGADPGILGRPLSLDGQPVTVVGVMPPVLLPSELIGEGRFRFSDRDERIFVPFPDVPTHHGHTYGVLGRLKRGVSLDEARAELDVIGKRMQQSNPDTHADYRASAEALTDELLGSARQVLGALLLSALLLLVVACTNVAHYQLVRVLERESASAVRAALGASRWQVARPFVLEGLLLAIGGGILGSALAYGALRSAVVLLPPELPRVASAEVDLRSLGTALALSLLAGSAIGLIAGSRSSRPHLSAGLRSGPRLKGGTSVRLRQLLLAGQASLAVVLVAVAGLLAETLGRLSSVATGFEKGELLVVELNHGLNRYRERPQLVALYDELQRRAAALPGVDAVGASYDPPLRSNWYQSFELQGAAETPPGRGPGGLFRTVTPGYFAAVGLRISEGRAFTDADDVGRPGAAIVNQALARSYFEGASPLGRKISLTTTQWVWGESIPREFTIVGVAENERIRGLAIPPEPTFYLPYRQTPQHQMSLLLRTSVDAASFLPSVTRLVHAIDPSQPIAASTTIRTLVSEELARPRLNALLATAFGLTALALAALGISAALAESISRRREELGVRLALGSSPHGLFGLAIRDGLRPAVVGVLAGSALSLAAARLIASQLYAVKPGDPTLHAGACAAVLVISLLACVNPAWRASRTDPATALRHWS